MTIPSIEHVIKKRHHNRRRLRFLALILVLIGFMWATWLVLEAILVDHTTAMLLPMVVYSGGFILPALPLWFFDERISRALAPMPRLECPVCRYNLTALARPLCPECGLTLPASFAPLSDQTGIHSQRVGIEAPPQLQADSGPKAE